MIEYGSIESSFLIGAVCLVLLAVQIHRIWISTPGYPLDLPWVGLPSGFFAQSRAHLSSIIHVQKWLHEGYIKVGVANHFYHRSKALPALLIGSFHGIFLWYDPSLALRCF